MTSYNTWIRDQNLVSHFLQLGQLQQSINHSPLLSFAHLFIVQTTHSLPTYQYLHLLYNMRDFLRCFCLLLALFATRVQSFSFAAKGAGRQSTTNTEATQGNVVVAPARLPQDLPQIRACRAAAFDRPVEKLLTSQKTFVNATTVVEGRASCLVAREKSGVVLGTADYKKKLGSITIFNVFVTPEARGQGLAKRFLQAIEEEALSQGVKKLDLQVDTMNTPAYNLYQRTDFKASGIYSLLAQISKATSFPFLIEMEKELE